MKRGVYVLVIIVLLPKSAQAWPGPNAEIITLAHIIEGEAKQCDLEAKFALAHIYSRNPHFNGWLPPSDESLAVAATWFMIDDPTDGAIHWFDAKDKESQIVADIIADLEEGPVYPCGPTTVHTYRR